MNHNNSQNHKSQDDQIDLIARTVVGHTVQFDKHTVLLDKHTVLLDKHTVLLDKHTAELEKHTVLLNKHTVELEKHTAQLDKITRIVVQHTEDIEWIKEHMAEKKDIADMGKTLDQILGLVKKKDQELTFMGERVKRIEDDVKKMKPLVGLA